MDKRTQGDALLTVLEVVLEPFDEETRKQAVRRLAARYNIPPVLTVDPPARWFAD